MSEPSPKPWAIKEFAIVDRDGRVVCGPIRGADAEDIVRCVNAYDGSLDACEAALKVLTFHPSCKMENSLLRAAIAEAKP